jgi:hypothetical protein
MCLGSPGNTRFTSDPPVEGHADRRRKDKNLAVMKPIVAKLSDREMVAVAAYLASDSSLPRKRFSVGR